MSARSAASNERASTAERELVIKRTYDAPLDLVWQVWSDPEHAKNWWGPKGFTMLSAAIDLRPGGVFHYGMRTPNGDEMWGRWIFREVVKPERLVFVVSFSDAAGGQTRHPWAPAG